MEVYILAKCSADRCGELIGVITDLNLSHFTMSSKARDLVSFFNSVTDIPDIEFADMFALMRCGGALQQRVMGAMAKFKFSFTWTTTLEDTVASMMRMSTKLNIKEEVDEDIVFEGSRHNPEAKTKKRKLPQVKAATPPPPPSPTPPPPPPARPGEPIFPVKEEAPEEADQPAQPSGENDRAEDPVDQKMAMEHNGHDYPEYQQEMPQEQVVIDDGIVTTMNMEEADEIPARQRKGTSRLSPKKNVKKAKPDVSKNSPSTSAIRKPAKPKMPIPPPIKGRPSRECKVKKVDSAKTETRTSLKETKEMLQKSVEVEREADEEPYNALLKAFMACTKKVEKDTDVTSATGPLVKRFLHFNRDGTENLKRSRNRTGSSDEPKRRNRTGSSDEPKRRNRTGSSDEPKRRNRAGSSDEPKRRNRTGSSDELKRRNRTESSDEPKRRTCTESSSSDQQSRSKRLGKSTGNEGVPTPPDVQKRQRSPRKVKMEQKVVQAGNNRKKAAQKFENSETVAVPMKQRGSRKKRAVPEEPNAENNNDSAQETLRHSETPEIAAPVPKRRRRIRKAVVQEENPQQMTKVAPAAHVDESVKPRITPIHRKKPVKDVFINGDESTDEETDRLIDDLMAATSRPSTSKQEEVLVAQNPKVNEIPVTPSTDGAETNENESFSIVTPEEGAERNEDFSRDLEAGVQMDQMEVAPMPSEPATVLPTSSQTEGHEEQSVVHVVQDPGEIPQSVREPVKKYKCKHCPDSFDLLGSRLRHEKFKHSREQFKGPNPLF